MLTNPLVSIITVTRNRASLISRCIESVQKQNYSNYEHIILDGNSEDNTQDVVFAYNDPKIKYKKIPTFGHKVQLLAAYEMSSGDYFAFLDDDDEYTIDGLVKRVSLLNSLPASYGFVYAAMDYYDDKTKEFLYRKEATINDGGPEILHKVIADPIVCGAPTLLFRREAYYSVSGGSWVNGAGNDGADFLLCAVCVKRGWRFSSLKNSTANVYVNHNAVRLTNTWASGMEGAKRSITYANFILSEFEDTVKVYPKSASRYYSSLMYDYIHIGEYKLGFKNYINLVMTSFSLKNLLRLPHDYYLKLASK